MHVWMYVCMCHTWRFLRWASGGAENARPENDRQRKLWVWKMQEWKMTDKNYGVWKMQEYKSSWVQPTHTMYIKEAVRDTLQSRTGMSSHLQLSVFRTSGATAALRRPTPVIITNYYWHIAYKECCNLVHRKRQEFAMEGSTEYRAIPKGRGFVCLLAPRDGVVLVPCGHSRFCA